METSAIIRSPVRAIALTRPIRSASSLALLTARDTAKRRQRIGGVGIQLRKNWQSDADRPCNARKAT